MYNVIRIKNIRTAISPLNKTRNLYFALGGFKPLDHNNIVVLESIHDFYHRVNTLQSFIRSYSYNVSYLVIGGV